MLRNALFSVSFLCAAFVGPGALGQPSPGQPPKLTDEQQEKLKSREPLLKEVEVLLNEGKISDVRTRVEKCLAITKEVVGENHAEVAQFLDGLIDICVQLEDFPAAREYGQNLVAVNKKLNGEKHWKTTDAQLKLAEVDVRAKLTKDQRSDLNDVGRLMVEVRQFQGRGQYQKALELAEKAVAKLKAILGEKHTLYAAGKNNLAMMYQSQGMIARAEPLFKQVLAIRKELLGEKHPVYASSLNNVAITYHYQSSFAKAEPLFKEALAIFKETLGDKHAEYINCLNNLAICYCKQGLFAKAEPLVKESLAIQEETSKEKPLEYSTALNSLATLFDNQGLFTVAEPLYLKAGAILKEITGARSIEMANFLNALAARYESQSFYPKAEPLFKEALAAYKLLVGDKHPLYAACLLNYAQMYMDEGFYTKAEILYKQVQAIYKELNATGTYEYALCLNYMAGLYQANGSLARAESLNKEALAICKKTLGEKHPDYAAIMHNLAEVYDLQGQFEKSEPLHQEARAIVEDVVGEKLPVYAGSLNKLAFMYERKGQLADAELLFKDALAIRKETVGERHRDYAESLSNLALVYAKQKAFAKAEPLFKEALAISKEVLGEKHPDYATCLNNLASLYFSEGKFDKSEPLFQELLAIRKQTTGDKHFNYALSLNNLSNVYRAQGMLAKAEPLEREALATIVDNLVQTAAGASEAGQLTFAAKARGILNNLLAHAEANPADVYAIAFRLHGAVNARQAFARAAQKIDPKAQQTLEDLRNISVQLSNLINSPPKPGTGVDIPKLQRELNEKRDNLEKTLADASKDFARYRDYLKLTPADMQKLLPADSVLIDFLAYEEKIAAFIITSKSIARVDLKGGNQLAEMVEEFRKPSSLKRFRPVQGEDDDSLLYKTVWEPLLHHLKGANLILICPDGPLCQLPFAALRGTDPKKYLIEEVAIAVVPVPQMLAELLANRPTSPATPPSLLVVGDVDFDGDPGAGKLPGDMAVSSPARAGGPFAWKPLSETKSEIATIEKLFHQGVSKGTVQSLSREKATEAAIRREIPKHRYLLFATHGFFTAPAQNPKPDAKGLEMLEDNVRSPETNPGLLCGLVCAGANKPTLDDDGVLTGLEIMDLNLSGVELAVLSACETGLGELKNSEGVLGLQRAFQLAGARTTVASLWQVPDAARSALLTRFYENRFQKNLSVLESLREAQLWVLNNSVKAGILTEEPKNGRRTPPIYWAAFTLAGDWR